MKNQKVRMVLCDVDGTLLPKGKQKISKEIFDAISYATSQNIHFVIASGRCYSDLKELFFPVHNLVTYICNDGTLAIKNDQVLFSASIPNSTVSALFDKAQLLPNESLVVYSENQLYRIGSAPSRKHTDFDSTSHPNEVSDNIYKLSFYNLSLASRTKIRRLAAYTGALSEVYSDHLWTEFIPKGINKGTAAKILQEKWQIDMQETAAFGDNKNDIEMLRNAKITFATQNAISVVKRMCKYCTSDIPNEIIKFSQGGSML